MSGECISSFYYNASSFVSNQWQYIATKLQPNSTDLPNLKSFWLQEPNFLKSTTKQPPCLAAVVALEAAKIQSHFYCPY